jgi:hypothetical protein
VLVPSGVTLTDPVRMVSHDRIVTVAGFYNGVARVHADTANGDHFHIRFQ